MHSFSLDLRFVGRSLSRSPAFSLLVVLTLGLGIGANTAIFSVIDAMLRESLPYSQPERLYMFWNTSPQFQVPHFPISEGGYLLYRDASRYIEDLAGFRMRRKASGRAYTLAGPTPLRVNGVMCSSNLFRTLGVEPMLGRDFRPEESQPDAPKVVILSHGLWSSRFGGRESVLGEKISLDGVPHEVIGVLPPDFYFPPPIRDMGGMLIEARSEIFVPYAFDPDMHVRLTVRAVARLKEGATPEQAEDQLDPVGERIYREFAQDEAFKGLGVRLRPLHEQAVEGLQGPLWALQAAVALLLLIACLNVTNLMLSRTAGRERELAVRAAMGAGRRRIIRLVFLESLLLALGGTVLGIVLAYAGRGLLRAISASYLPRLNQVELDWSVLAFAAFLAVLSTVVFGAIPAFKAARPDLNEALKEGSRSASVGGQMLRRALVVAEVAVAMVLLVGAGLLFRSVQAIEQVSLGFREERSLAMQVSLPESRYPHEVAIRTFFERLAENAEEIPAVQRAAAISQVPFGGALARGGYKIQGRDVGDARPSAEVRYVTPGYFETLGIELLEGRAIDQRDREGARPVVVIDRRLVERDFQGKSPLGEYIEVIREGLWHEVVGVVESVRHSELRDEAEDGIIYLPFAQFPQPSMYLVARTAVPPEQVFQEVRRAVGRLDPQLPVEPVAMSDYVDQAQATVVSPAAMIGVFAGLAVVLAAVGLYGVIAILVSSRVREIGIRIALGGGRGEILRLVGRQAAVLTLLGILCGILAALGLSQVLSARLGELLFRVAPSDPATYSLVALLFLLVAALATLIPAQRALSVQPAQALREE